LALPSPDISDPAPAGVQADRADDAAHPLASPVAMVGRWSLAAILAHLLAAWVVFAFAFTPLRASHDEFWHLKTGQWISEHGRLPVNDVFTYTAANIPWNNHEWLAEVAAWKIWQWAEATRLGGWRAVILVKALLIVAAYCGLGLLVARRLREPAWGALAAAVAAALARRTFYPRPPVITYALLALLLWMLMEWRAGRLRARWLALLAPLFALWANLHGGWMAGLVVVAAFWAEACLGAVLATRYADGALPVGLHAARGRLTALTAAGLGCALGSLVNPYGWNLYLLPLHVSSDAYLMSTIGEMMPPDWTHVWALGGMLVLMAGIGLRPASARGWAMALPALAAAGGALFVSSNAAWHGQDFPWVQLAVALPIFALAAWRTGQSGAPAHFLLLAFFGYQGIFHVRHLPLLAVVALPTLAAGLDGWAVALCGRGARKRLAHVDCGGLPPLVAPETNQKKAAASRRSPHDFAPRRFWARGWGALAVLAPLTVFWIFNHREGPSYLDRNRMLLNGMDFQLAPKARLDPKRELPASTTIAARGYFMVDPYPVQATDFLLAARLPGPIFNGGNYAGYLIWRLSPGQYKVFTDNRYDIYGGVVIRDEHSVLNGWTQDWIDKIKVTIPHVRDGRLEPWNVVLDRWGVQTAFLPVDALGNAALERSGRWTRVYEDLDWAIWVRSTPANQEAIDRAQAMPRPAPWRQIARLIPGEPGPPAARQAIDGPAR
jgi:hypothetical protein